MYNQDIAAAATGRTPCDLTIVNCRIVDVFSGLIVENSSISISRGRILGVNDDLRSERVLDAGGRFLAPGFMDAHVHIESSLLSPAEYARIVVPRGTLSIAADPHEIVNVLGYDGMNYIALPGRHDADKGLLRVG
jgi:adenine deaminase